MRSFALFSFAPFTIEFHFMQPTTSMFARNMPEMVLVHLSEYLTNESQLQLALNLIRLEISEANAGTIVVRRRLTMFGDFRLSFSNLTKKHLVRQRQTENLWRWPPENLSATVWKSLFTPLRLLLAAHPCISIMDWNVPSHFSFGREWNLQFTSKQVATHRTLPLGQA